MHLTPPKQITIGGITISIRVESTMESWGEYHSDDREIVLSSKTLAKASTLRSTLRHEMMHAALDIAGIVYIKQFEEEAIVRCIDNIFHPAWDNMRKLLKH
jgi:hypothetical protein